MSKEPVEKKRKIDQDKERRKAVGLDGTVRARLYTRRKRDRVVTELCLVVVRFAFLPTSVCRSQPVQNSQRNSR